MIVKHDISSCPDIKLLVDQFYSVVKNDPLLGEFFTSVMAVDWNEHLPQMYDFWESVLFSKKIFSGNPMQKHRDLNQKKLLKIEHFDRWLEIFHATVGGLFKGENATLLKQKAAVIKENLSAKIISSPGIFNSNIQ